MAIFERIEDSTAGRRRLSLTSPANMEPLGEIECASKEDVDAAVAKARAAQPAWAALSIAQRVEYMRKLRTAILDNQDRIIDIVVRETGKPLQDAIIFEIYAACDFITYYCSQAQKMLQEERKPIHGVLRFTKKLRVFYKPLGVVGVISPWNGPFILTANPCIQALLAGNTVVAKGSEVTPWCAKVFEEMCHEAGFPQGVCQVLMGDGETGGALTASSVDKISFTGSVATGKRVAIACIETLKPYTLELGGKDAMIVCADANLEEAAHAALWGSCVNTGHFCCGTERIYVEAAVYDQLLEKVVRLAKQIRQGRKFGMDEDVGAVFWDRQMAIIEAHVDDAKARGAQVHCGGERLKDMPGLYYPPTVLTEVGEDWDVMAKETFGPVIPIVKVKDIEEALEKANASSYGLHGSVWTKDEAKGVEIAKRMETGSVAVNDIGVMYGIPTAPFGGVKESGVGHIHGDAGLRNYCHPHPVITGKYGGLQTGYPYSEKSFRQMKQFMDFMYKNPIGKFLFG